MSYSRPTLAAFSDAMGVIYSSPGTHSIAASVPLEATVKPREKIEDLAYLEELLDTHRRAIAHPRQPANDTPEACSKGSEQNFARLCGAGLTPRECEILFWIAEGKHDAEIAIIVACAPKTVSKHVENILAKFGAETRLAAAHTAHEWLEQNM
jgi:DNA-binding CsgD family transcriptional regulator